MHRRLQFGMRENPASDRRHGSRSLMHEGLSNATGGHSSCEQGMGFALDSSQVESVDMERLATGEGREQGPTSTATVGAIKVPGEKVRQPISNDGEFEPLLDVDEAARLLKIHPKTLRVKAGHGIIPGMQIGRVWRFRASMLNRWLESVAICNRR